MSAADPPCLRQRGGRQEFQVPLERDRHHVATSTYGYRFRLTTVVGKMTVLDQQTIAQPSPLAGESLTRTPAPLVSWLAPHQPGPRSSKRRVAGARTSSYGFHYRAPIDSSKGNQGHLLPGRVRLPTLPIPSAPHQPQNSTRVKHG